MASSSTALLISNESSDHSRVLLQEIVQDSSKRAEIAELTGEDAQCIADLLSVLLHEDGAFTSEGRQFFGLLKSLVKSSKVLPQCYKLQDLQCDFRDVREGGGFADILEGKYRKWKVCVKAVRVFGTDSKSKWLQVMAKEAVLWAHLSHRNILPFYGVHIPHTSGRICIISPWMERGDLSAYLSKFPGTPRLPLVRDIIAGLRYLHASDIVHGDLKANNVLISDNGCALIADFGISYLLASANTASFIASNGTTRWKAPELAVERCLPTLQSDMWSFGCLCHEVFTCEVPFCDLTNDFQISSALMKGARRPGDVNQFDGFSIKGRELVNRCWDYKPGSRPSCEEIYESVIGQVGERDDLEVQDVALWKTIRGGSEVTIDHVRAHRVLHGIKGTCESRHDSTPSKYPIPTTQDYDSCSIYASTRVPPGGLPPPSGLPSLSGFHTPGLKSGEHNPPPNTSHAISMAGAFPGGYNSHTHSHPKDIAEVIDTSQKIQKDDIIIAFMGPTGAGKSYFIDLLTGQKGKRAGSGLKAVTSQIQATRVRRQGYGDRILLVDIPGFDDTIRSDMKTLQVISDWLQKTYSMQVKLSGLIYLHRITDNCMDDSSSKTLRIFGELCGDAAMTQVRLVTTRWGEVKPEDGEGRERVLRDRFWKSFIEKGSRTERLRDTTGEEAWRIVEGLIHDSKKRDIVLLQEELVELEKQLNKTAAGKTLYTSLQKLLADQKVLLAQVEKSNDPNLTKELEKEYARINDQFQRTFQEVTKLKISIGKRIMQFFFGKKGSS